MKDDSFHLCCRYRIFRRVGHGTCAHPPPGRGVHRWGHPRHRQSVRRQRRDLSEWPERAGHLQPVHDSSERLPLGAPVELNCSGRTGRRRFLFFCCTFSPFRFKNYSKKGKTKTN